MKYRLAIKLLAFVACIFALWITVASAVGVIFLASTGLYDSTPEDYIYQRHTGYYRHNAARHIADYYATQTMGTCPESILSAYFDTNTPAVWSREFQYTVTDQTGKTVVSTYSGTDETPFTYEIASTCLVFVGSTDTEPEDIGAYVLSKLDPSQRDNYLSSSVMLRGPDPYTHSYGWIHLAKVQGPTYQISIYPVDFVSVQMGLLKTLWECRWLLICTLIGGLLLTVACAVYLFSAAGREPNSDTVRPAALNRLPIDLYAGAAGIGIVGSAYLAIEILCNPLSSTSVIGTFLVCGGLLLLACTLCVAFAMALAAQSKAHMLWRHSVTGSVLRGVRKGLVWCFHGCARLFRLLPALWQWLAAAGGCFFLFLISLAIGSPLGVVLAIVAGLALFLYAACAFGSLLKRVRQMRQGDLSCTHSAKWLVGCFGEFSECLDAVTEGASAAARKQMRSERMKTELITNVSHDIKTPLTSIINYVDLLQKCETQEQQTEYLEVLERQSQRMKKLLDDLMDMSKATSGNLPVDIQTVDAVEAIKQALGEFSDKLADLTPVFSPPEKQIFIHADGRLVWRVLSNLLSNASKYALPGTRLYLDMKPGKEWVEISLKNISREPLNIPADELMERFVRGDASRNTEGSGLGLNIAASLMELQHGKLELWVDGDLFKVTLLFPAAQA